MTATTQAAQDFLTLLRKLMGAKPSKETAIALLDESATWIECLLVAAAEQEIELAEARQRRTADFAAWAGLTAAGYPADGEAVTEAADLADCECCDVSYPRGELISGLCPTCLAAGCGNVRPRVAAEFDAGHALRPPEWQCSRCQMRFDGRKPEDGICKPCETLPPKAAPEDWCGAKDTIYLCNAPAGHEPLDHVEWHQDGTIAARWPVTVAGAQKTALQVLSGGAP